MNFGLAGLALLISTSLWVLVVNDQNPERVDIPDVAISVEVNRVPPGMVVMNNLEPVRFKVRAPKDKWPSLRASSFRASVDLSRLGPGIQAVPVVAEASDPQVRVLEVIPNTVSVRLEEIRERTVPVKVNLVGNVPFGYVYDAPKVEPEAVVVSGPASLVQNVEAAVVEVRLEGITVEIDSSFHPLPADSSGTTVRGVQLTPQTVKVRLPVEQQVSYKQVGVRATIVGTVSPGYWIESVSTEPSSVTVVGDPKALARINYLDTSPLNVGGATSSIVQEVRIATPPGVSLVQQQQTARVTAQVSPLQTSQVVRVAPRVVNLSPKLAASGVPPFVDATLKGSAPVLQGLKIDSLSVTLDVKDLGEGRHPVRPTVTTPPGVAVVAVEPETVFLILETPATPTPVPPAGTPSASTGGAPSTDAATPAPPPTR